MEIPRLADENTDHAPQGESFTYTTEELVTSSSASQDDIASSDPRPELEETEDDYLSKTSSVDSFHTIASEDEDIPAAPQEDHRSSVMLDTLLGRPKAHKREVSELTVTQMSHEQTADSSEEPPAHMDGLSTPPLAPASVSDASWGDVPTPLSNTVQDTLRHRLKTRRSPSPMPHQSTMISPTRQRQEHTLPSAILQKVASIAVVKPIDVVVFLVHIVSRIASGATINDLLSGDLFRRPEQQRRRTPNLPDHIDARRGDTDSEDDFGVPIRTKRSASEDVRTDDDADSLFDID